MKKQIISFISALFFSVTLLAGDGHNHNHKQPEKINVNNATLQQLDKELIGVGAKTAMAIIEFREKNGPFENAEDLMKVKRVGKAIIDKNKDRIVFK